MFCIRTSVVSELPQLRRYALFLAKDKALADDLVQDCVARAIDRGDQFQPGTNFRAWLFTILRSVFLNHKRSVSNRPFEPEDAATSSHLSVRPGQETRIEVRELERALSKLSGAHRDILLLVVVEGFSYEEAAGILGVPLGTVRSRLARARQDLHHHLASDGGSAFGAKGVEANG